MKALSVQQPWAQLMVLGHRPFEVRPWHVAHRGRLAVHAAVRFPTAMRRRCLDAPAHQLLRAAGFADPLGLPRGALVGEVDLLECVPAQDRNSRPGWAEALGELPAGSWVWVFAAPAFYRRPVPCRGRLGLFDVACHEGSAGPAASAP